jgi:hypothetical protein
LDKATLLLRADKTLRDYKKLKYWLRIAAENSKIIGKEKEFTHFLYKISSNNQDDESLRRLLTLEYNLETDMER